MKNLKRKNLVLALLVVLALAVAGTTYAYWASGVTGNTVLSENTITVGSGEEVTTTVTLTGGTTNTLDLVPVGREVTDVSVSSITYTFNVTWAGASSAADAAGATGTLNISSVFAGLQSDGLTAVGTTELALFTVTPDSTQAITYGDTAIITITVVFTEEPVDAAQYDLIADATLTLDVTFLVDAVTPA